MADKLLKSITFPDLTDKYIIGDTSLSVAGAGADSKATGDALATKANIDGYYDSMTVGNAEQLVSNVRVNDKTPYLFRTSGGSVDIGDREYVNGIVGGTVAWNQLVQNGNFASDTGWGTNGGTKSVANNVLTLTSTVANNVGIYQSVSTINGHKYLLSGDIKITTGVSSVAMRWVLSDGGSGNDKSAGTISSGVKTNSSVIVSPTSNWSRLYILSPYSGSGMAVGDKIEFSNFMCFDLTQMFGSTIADYIYSLETANAGAGVAWFKKLFNKPYYAYNAGELKSVSGLVSHDMTGFNQWDEVAESGIINAQGGDSDSTTFLRSKNYVRVTPNTGYYFKIPNTRIFIAEYDANKTFIKRTNYTTPSTGKSYTMSADTHYVRFCFGGEENPQTTYGNNVCVNIAWDNSRNGEYEPYELHSYPLDTDLTLRGIPKLDANNNLYYDGDNYEADGTVTRKYGIVDMGTLTWSKNNNIYATSNITDMKLINTVDAPNAICQKYPFGKWQDIEQSNPQDKTIYMLANSQAKQIRVYESATYADATAFKTAMSGVYLVYELATPTTETADPYQQVEVVNDFGTEEYVIDSNTFAVPVGSDTDYPVNLVAKLEMAPNSPDGSGDYIVRQTNGVNEYVPLVIEDALPTIPSTAGTYTLTVTVADGADPVLSWEA